MSRLCRVLYWGSVPLFLLCLSWSYAYLPTRSFWSSFSFSKESFFYAALIAFFVAQLSKLFLIYVSKCLNRNLYLSIGNNIEIDVRDMSYLLVFFLNICLSAALVYVSLLKGEAQGSLVSLGSLMYVPVAALLVSATVLIYMLRLRRASK